MLATEPGQRATVEVALAVMGRTPVKISAGKERKLTQPATEFKVPARTAATNSKAALGRVIFYTWSDGPDSSVRGYDQSSGIRYQPFLRAAGRLRAARGRACFPVSLPE